MKTKESGLELKALKLYVEKNDVDKSRHIVSSFLSADIAHATKDWPLDEKISLIKVLNAEEAAEYLHNLEDDDQKLIINNIDAITTKKLISELDSDEAVDIIEELDDEVKDEVLKDLDAKTRKGIKRIMRYEETDAGYHMSINYVKVDVNLTKNQAFKIIKQQLKDDAELAGNVYVIDEADKLQGRVPIEELLIASGNEKISDIMEPSPSLTTKENLSKVNEYFERYGEESIPLTTMSNKLVGIIEPQDILEVLNDYNQIVVGASSVSGETTKQYKNYLGQSSFAIFKTRIFWIFTLLFVGLLTQVIITGFQQIWGSAGNGSFWNSAEGAAGLSSVVTIAFATALGVASSINDSAGNSGSQSSSVIIEAMAMGEIKNKDSRKVFMKEINVGAWIGGAVAIGSFARTYLVWAMFGQLNGLSGIDHGFMALTAAITSVSFMISVIFGNAIGAALPLVGNKFGWNSAVISGPVSTTIIDIFVFAFYLGLITAVYVPMINAGVFDSPDITGTLIQVVPQLQRINLMI